MLDCFFNIIIYDFFGSLFGYVLGGVVIYLLDYNIVDEKEFFNDVVFCSYVGWEYMGYKW